MYILSSLFPRKKESKIHYPNFCINYIEPNIKYSGSKFVFIKDKEKDTKREKYEVEFHSLLYLSNQSSI